MESQKYLATFLRANLKTTQKKTKSKKYHLSKSHLDFRAITTYKYYRNIKTEELQIVRNNKLRKLFAKSPKYGETNNILWEIN